MTTLSKMIFIAAGTLSVGLGVVGILLPLMPTTPFLLLAAFFYSRSSDRFYHWLVTNRWFGDYIRDYREGRGIRRRHKMTAITTLWVAILFSTWLVSLWWVGVILFIIASCVTMHLLWMKTRTEDEAKKE
jgi:uncharacterized protein